MNKKGQNITQLFILIAIGMTIILFFGIWIFGTNIVTDALTNITLPASTINQTGINFSQITQDTLGNVQEGYDFLTVIAVLMLFGFSISILLSSFLERTHPGLGFIIHIIVTIIAIVFAVYVSNAYEDLLVDPILGTTLNQFTGGSFIMLNLPVWVAVIGIVGIILLMAGIPRDKELGGGV